MKQPYFKFHYSHYIIQLFHAIKYNSHLQKIPYSFHIWNFLFHPARFLRRLAARSTLQSGIRYNLKAQL